MAGFGVLLASSVGAGCGAGSVCKFEGTVNAPEQRSMRRGMMATGLDAFCKKMLRRSAPLKVASDAPSTGRFFTRSCAQRTLGNGDLDVSFGGEGYAYSPLTQKLVFESQNSVAYTQDFKAVSNAQGCGIYGLFKPANVAYANFRIRGIQASTADNLFGNSLVQAFGSQVVSSKIGEGFTVVRDASGGEQVSFGVSATPRAEEFAATGDWLRYESARVDLHGEQRDFIGPIDVSQTAALRLRTRVDGGVAVEAFLVSEAMGTQALAAYLGAPQAQPMAGIPLRALTLAPGAALDTRIRLAKGSYYVVLDNTSSAGMVAPPVATMHDAVATVSYAVELLER